MRKVLKVSVAFLFFGGIYGLTNAKHVTAEGDSRPEKAVPLPPPTHAASDSGSFAPGIVSHEPTKEELTEGNDIKTEALCKKKHGQWFYEKGHYAYCVLPYPDAGKPCKSSKDCIGHCIAPLDDTPSDHGTCQVDDSRDDCGRPHYENGKVIYFKCD